MTTSEHLPGWQDYLARLSETGCVALQGFHGLSPAELEQEGSRLLFEALAAGTLGLFLDPLHPDFVPLASSAIPMLGTNPDFIYACARIDGRHTYRLRGTRGKGLFLVFDIGAGGLGPMDELGPSVGVLDVDNLQLGANGAFDVLLSGERPADWQGDWFKLDVAATTLTARQAAYDWAQAPEARFAIECVDGPHGVQRLSPEQIAARLQRLADYPLRVLGFAATYLQGQRDRGFVNRLERDDWAGRGGIAGQHYYQCLFRLEAGQALVLETDVPEHARYWNIQINDPLWRTIDWSKRFSSINARQAHIDADGRLCVVIAHDDPGFANWLDTGGYTEGTLMLRWMEASSAPRPSLRLIPLARLDEAMPPDSPRLTREERGAALRQRGLAVQLRRRW
ncbi:MAG: DUF1214 domain-containing protein [Pseudomonadota bacterium]|nr:DUF1214 domain-containing protein [Pseudomonadota bacterium]